MFADRLPIRPVTLLASAALVVAGCARTPAPTAPAPAPRPGGENAARPAANGGGAAANARGPRPYAQVITARAKTDRGGITVHQVGDNWFFEVPDSLAARDFLLVSRVAGVPSNFLPFLSAGASVDERLVRWQRVDDRLLLRSAPGNAYADDSLPIARSVAVNNVGPVLGAFPIAAFTPDSTGVVIDVTSFFSGDTPAISGLNPALRRQYQVRRLDPARSFVETVRSFPLNVEVRHTQTFDAAAPPSDESAGTITLTMRQSLVLLPKEPMRPRYADARVGFFSVNRVNYGLDEQKAAEERFIRRWRLEPKDPAAYARGELVEPVQPIVYYLDPATPAKWAPYVKQGVEDWQAVFEKAGFRNAIIAKEAPTPAEDPEWDPEDIRYSVVRWVASTVRNAVGPSTSDPRTGEIIESDITWYHNHMRSYRNRLMVETGAANPAARSLDIPEELMGETMRKVITHEVGHAIGLPHNMVASASFPVDSLRSAAFTTKYGVSATIMDYARQNYVAQPGDGLAPKDFIRRLGPFDDFVIEWGYRVFPDAATPADERATLHRMLTGQTGPFPYRYVPQQYGSLDPRAQTEDLGDDPVGATRYAIANLKRVVPELVSWTTQPGEDYEDLDELYGEAVSMWQRYLGHVVTVIGGVRVDFKTADQAGAVYSPVSVARQREAADFLLEQIFGADAWLAPAAITSRTGPANLALRQASILAQMVDVRRLARMADLAAEGDGWAPADYLATLRRAVWGPAAPDATRRTLQRAHLERLTAILAPPSGGGQGGGFGGGNAPAWLAAPNVSRSDLPALARRELTALRALAAGRRDSGSETVRAHWADVVARVDAALEPAGE